MIKQDPHIAKLKAQKRCFACGEFFSSENVFTDAGWRETEISGMCEKCFDAAFEDTEE